MFLLNTTMENTGAESLPGFGPFPTTPTATAASGGCGCNRDAMIKKNLIRARNRVTSKIPTSFRGLFPEPSRSRD